MKKFSNIVIFIFVFFIVSIVPAYAKEMTLDELGEKIEAKGGNYAFIIGDYVFTSEHGGITTQDIMLASRSINIEREEEKSKDDKYKAMTIYEIRQRFEDDELKWTFIENTVGETKFNQSKISIHYIDYEYVPEDANIRGDLAKTEQQESQYKTKLTELQFEGNSKNSSGLTLTPDQKKKNLQHLSGIIFKNNKVTPETVGYYFALALEVENATSSTKVEISGAEYKNTSLNDFYQTGSDSYKGMAILFSLDKNTDLQNRKIVIKVDLDGEQTEYGPTEYIIDWSSVEFQEDSKANIDTNDDKIPAEVSETLTKWKYEKGEDDYHLESDESGLLLKGTVNEKELADNVFAEKKGYYFVFNIALDQSLITDDITITLPCKTCDTGKKTFKKDYLVDGVLTVLFKLDDKKTNTKIEIEVDYDGNKDKYIPVKYTIDYKDLTFNPSS